MKKKHGFNTQILNHMKAVLITVVTAFCLITAAGITNVSADRLIAYGSASDVGIFRTYDLSDTELLKIARLCQQEQGTARGAAAEASLMANLYEKQGGRFSSLYEYVRNCGWWANSAHFMDYGSASDAVVNAVSIVLREGKRTLPGYVDEHDCFSDIASVSNNGAAITKTNRSLYQQYVTVIRNKMKATYTFYCFPDSASDPFGYISETRREQIGEAYYTYGTWELQNADSDIVGHEMGEDEAAGRTISDGDYWIATALSEHLFTDITGVGAAESGTNVAFYNCAEGTMPTEYDIFTVTYLNNGFYRIKQRSGNVCLEVADASLYSDANVRVFKNNGTPAQQWSIRETDTGYQIQARCSGFSLDVCGAVATDGANAMVHTSNGDPNQRFLFIPADTSERPIADGVYQILAAGNTAFSLDGSGQPSDYKPGTNVAIWKDAGELFSFKHIANGWYLITEYHSGLSLDVDNSGHQNFADRCRNIMLHTVNKGKNQLWHIQKNSDGTFTFISKLSGYALNLYGNNLTNGGNVCQHPRDNSTAERWKVIQKTYTLRVNPNGGTYDGSTSVVTKSPQLIFGGENWWHIAEKGNASRKGYTLTGFFDKASGGTKVYGSDGISAESKYFRSKTYVNMGDLTVYAQWIPNEYSLSFDSCGGSAVAAQKVKMDTKIGTLSDSKRDGYNFEGWYTEKTGGTKITADTVFRDAAAKMLYAHWTPIPVVTKPAAETTTEPTTKMTTGTTTETTTVTEQTKIIMMLGDINGDSRITAVDLTLAKRALLTNAPSNPAADVNRDGSFSIADIVWYVKFLTGQISAFS